MTDPIRWLDQQGDTSELERAVLESDLGAEPPADAADRGWERLLGALGPVPPFGPAGGAGSGGGAGLGSAASAGGVTAATAKAFLVGLAVGGALTGAGALVTTLRNTPAQVERASPTRAIPVSSIEPHRATSIAQAARSPSDPDPSRARPGATHVIVGSPEPSVASTPARAEATPERSAAAGSLPDLLDAESVEAPALPNAPSPAAGPRSSQRSSLEQEAALVREARRRLHAGDVQGAFAELEALRTWFPNGVLLQEREALTVDLLARSGQRDAAEARARAFVRTFPRSPFTPSVRRVLERRP
jgi:hypothetical protein